MRHRVRSFPEKNDVTFRWIFLLFSRETLLTSAIHAQDIFEDYLLTSPREKRADCGRRAVAAMLAATASAAAVTGWGGSQRGACARRASSRPWCAAPTSLGKWTTSLTPTSVSAQQSSGSVRPNRAVRSRTRVVLFTSTAQNSTKEGDSWDASSEGNLTTKETGGGPSNGRVPKTDASSDGSQKKTQRTPGQIRKAEKKAKYSAKHPGGHARDVSLHMQAKAFERAGDKDAALKLLTRGSRKFPGNAHIQISFAKAVAGAFSAGDLGRERHQLNKALLHLRKFLTDFPDESQKSSVLHQLIGVLAARIAEHGDDDDGGRNAGLPEKIQSTSSSLELAKTPRAEFQLATEIDPSHAGAWHAWGVFEMKNGRVAKAKRLLREAKRCDPKRARTAQALAFLESGDPARLKDARVLFQSAIGLQKNHVPSYTAWAQMEERSGNFSRAARVFREGEEATRDLLRGCGDITKKVDDVDADSDPKKSRSSLLAAFGSFESRRSAGQSWEKTKSHARTLFREAVQTSPGNQRAWVAWVAAETLFARRSLYLNGFRDAQNDGPECTKTLLSVVNEGLKKHPFCVQLLTQKAVAFRLGGDFDSAVAQLTALSKKSRNPKIWHALGVALGDAGRFHDAIDAFEFGALGCVLHDEGTGSRVTNPEQPGSVENQSPSRINLPCLTYAATAAARGGDETRARRLFAKGSSLASPGTGTDSPTSFDSFESFESRDVPNASVDGSGNAYETSYAGGSGGASGGSTSSSPYGRSGSCAPSRRERSKHLLSWAAFEKRCGKTGVARSLFQRASVADPADVGVWTQWGQARLYFPNPPHLRYISNACDCCPYVAIYKTLTTFRVTKTV